MSRRSQKNWRSTAVAEVLSDAIECLPAAADVLIAYDETGMLTPALAASGRNGANWNRRLAGNLAPSPWPAGGPYDAAMLRLPQAREEQDMALHAVTSVVRAGGRVLVCGANDEGIKVATPRIARLLGNADKVSARAHCRLIAAERPETIAGLKSGLADWRQRARIDLGDGPQPWVFYPGMFAEGRLDDGTALLLANLPEAPGASMILDFGAGSGLIAGQALRRWPHATIDMVDIDSVALEAARENVPGARAILGDSLAATAGRRYDLILSNPPLHAGHEETQGHLEQLIVQAPRQLTRDGILQIVVQRRIPLDAMLGQSFATAACVAENGTYRVWRASKARS